MESNHSDFFNSQLSEIERGLYDRQFRLDGWNQNILKNSKVLIVGVGGLGCETAKNLAMVGVGRLDLVDLDIVEFSNLNRQLLFTNASHGEPKALTAAKMLQQINPNIEIHGYHSSLEDLDPVLFSQTDVIIGGLDSIRARNNLNAQAIRFRKPLIDGGVMGYHGHIYTVFPYENACLECYSLSQAENEDMAACTVVGIPRKRIHCLFKAQMIFKEQFPDALNGKNIDHVNFLLNEANKLVEIYNFQPHFTQKEVVQRIDYHDAGLITINTVIASLQSHETIKVLNWIKGNKSLGEPMKQYVIYNGMTMKFYYLDKPKNEECIQCGKATLRVTLQITKEAPCAIILEKLIQMGYTINPDAVPILSKATFKGVTMIDTDQSVVDNKLRHLDLITAAGFKEGNIFVTLSIT